MEDFGQILPYFHLEYFSQAHSYYLLAMQAAYCTIFKKKKKKRNKRDIKIAGNHDRFRNGCSQRNLSTPLDFT